MTEQRAAREAARATTLAQARVVVDSHAPSPESDVDTRRAYHLWASGIYDHAADHDHDHQHEARAYAQCERNAADRCT